MEALPAIADKSAKTLIKKQEVENVTDKLKQAIWSYKFYAASTNILFY
jgi:hypothetical protein